MILSSALTVYFLKKFLEILIWSQSEVFTGINVEEAQFGDLYL